MRSVEVVVCKTAERRILLSPNFPATRQILEPATRGRGFRTIAVVLQEFTESLCGILILPHSGKRLCDKEFDLWSLAVRFSQRLLRSFQRLFILLMMVIGFGQRPLRLPPVRL